MPRKEINIYCVIQEIQTHRKDMYGYPKELRSEYLQCSIDGRDCSHYYYTYSSERFERPIKPSYRISIHSSYRKDGKPRKRQFVICTVKYYDIATGLFSLYDWGNSKIEMVAELLNVPPDRIYNLIETKLESLKSLIEAEFAETEEYRTHQEHERITTVYVAKKVQFAEQYEVDSSEYDRIYDVFGNLKNPDYLKKIQDDFKARKKYEQKNRSYQKRFYGNYNQYSSGTDNSSYCNSVSGNYNDTEKSMLKSFYRELSKRFHPDSNPDKDTSGQMQLLNKLKAEWSV